MSHVRCADCGYLAMRGFETHELIEVSEQMRATGVNPPGPTGRRIYDGRPLCAIWAFDLPAEVKGESEPERLAVFNRDRECAKIAAWQHGFTPKEHIQMDMLERQRERQEAWQREESARNRAWEERQIMLAQQHHDQTLAVMREETRWNWRGMMLAAAVGALATLAAVYFGYTLAPSQREPDNGKNSPADSRHGNSGQTPGQPKPTT